MKTSITKIATVILALTAASIANASPLVAVTDNYLYESLIQTEFDLENQMNASVEASTQASFEQVLMAAKQNQTEQLTEVVAE